MSKILIAFGGNAILRAGQSGLYEEQLDNIRNCCTKIVDLYKLGHTIVISHGNGPQVGNLLIQNEKARDKIPGQPLHSCVAQTQGQLGYMIQCELENEFRNQDLKVETATLLTRVLVDKDDEAFSVCTKPVGPFFPEIYAKERMNMGETWFEDSGRGWRRLVPSPQPKYILEIETIKAALKSCGVVIAAGGGGIPVIEENNGVMGVDAVIDKDLASAVMGIGLGLDTLVLLTSIDKVKLNFNKTNEVSISHMNSTEAESYLKEKQFGIGSMAPKIQAAIDFVRGGGKEAIITSFDQLNLAVEGQAGTIITR